MQNKIKIKNLFFLILATTLVSSVFLIQKAKAVEYELKNVDTLETWQINQDINEKRAEIQELKKQVEVYEKNIIAKKRDLNSLSSQISTLNESIGKINLEVKTVELEIETIYLKIENKQLKIEAKEKEIVDQKEIVATLLRKLHRQQQQGGLLEVLIMNDNFSEFMSEVDRLEKMQNSLVKEVKGLDIVRIALNNDKEGLEEENLELSSLKGILENKAASLDTQKVAKSNLIEITKGQEAQFQELLAQAQQEQKQMDSDIVYLEKVAREKLKRQLEIDSIDSDGLMWPVPGKVVTTYFHDPDYPYRYIFEHNAVDIRASQGTAIRAAESGYVVKAKNGGKTGYSYIMLIHSDGLSTVYGHINKIDVSEDQFVTKGSVIGYSGGMPGTAGAGPFTTGPHLHFEVRINGVPVNPLNYLP